MCFFCLTWSWQPDFRNPSRGSASCRDMLFAFLNTLLYITCPNFCWWLSVCNLDLLFSHPFFILQTSIISAKQQSWRQRIIWKMVMENIERSSISVSIWCNILTIVGYVPKFCFFFPNKIDVFHHHFTSDFRVILVPPLGLQAWLLFAVPFLARPLGSVFFGWSLGWKHGAILRRLVSVFKLLYFFFLLASFRGLIGIYSWPQSPQSP